MFIVRAAQQENLPDIGIHMQKPPETAGQSAGWSLTNLLFLFTVCGFGFVDGASFCTRAAPDVQRNQ